MKRKTVIVAAAIGIVALAGCGTKEANGYNLPSPNAAHNISNISWFRLDSPREYPTIVRACIKGDGVYENQDSANSVEVVPNDPACK